MPEAERKTASPLVLADVERERIDRARDLGAREAVGALIDMLTDRSWAVRRAVVEELAALGDRSITPLVQVLETMRDDEARLAASVDALVASTGDVDATVITE